MTNIVLCGGSGTRLWPISRTLMPKQFVKLFSDKSLFQLTIERNTKVCEKTLIVSNNEHYFLALDQLAELSTSSNDFLLEPIGRDTAPAIALACMSLNNDDIVLVTPSDHLIKNEQEYKVVVEKAKEWAQKNYLVTFGIKPTYPETGYGYIESDGHSVKAFHEKPDMCTAKKYLDDGNYYWNSGMFCFKAGVFLEELKKYALDIFQICTEVYKNAAKNQVTRLKYEDMITIPDKSIDYAVMEKSNKVKVIPSCISWSDLGSFDSLYNELEKNTEHNTFYKNHISINSRNNFIYGHDRAIATIDCNDLIIIDTPDAMLVSQRGSSQKVKEVVSKLKAKESTLAHIHLTGNRPWGSYTVLQETDTYKIKRINVNPKKRLSLQSHQYRNEHWIVVSGEAEVTINDNVFILNENESTYIKAGDIHRLSNNTSEELIVIEAQVGTYTGEDDIIRYEDDFDR